MKHYGFGLAVVLAALAGAGLPARAEVTAIAAGGAHTCALISTGAVKCWGYNYYGDLGDGTTLTRVLPTAVRGLASGVTAIAAGADHTCAVTAARTVLCWGYNAFGQLGDGTTLDRHEPVAVSVAKLSNVIGLAAGSYHTCALIATGGVKCWGWNLSGQLGDGTISQRNTPGPVIGLKRVVAIAAGGNHTCARNDTGGLTCWGDNGDGEIGDGTKANRLHPVLVIRRGISAIAAGQYHTCAATAAGSIKCWGHNDHGQLGDGTTAGRLAPTMVAASGFGDLTAGWNHTCARTVAGGVQCWGNNLRGNLGNGTTTDRLVPVNVSGLSSGVAGLAAGQDHTCALTEVGGVKCWGWNVFGQLGDRSDTNKLTPINVKGL